MLGSVFAHFRDITFIISIILLLYIKVNLISFHMQLKVSKLDLYI